MTDLTKWEEEIRESFLNGNRGWVRDKLNYIWPSGGNDLQSIPTGSHKKEVLAAARITASFNGDQERQESFIRCLEG